MTRPAYARTKLPVDRIDDVIFGCANQGGVVIAGSVERMSRRDARGRGERALRAWSGSLSSERARRDARGGEWTGFAGPEGAGRPPVCKGAT